MVPAHRQGPAWQPKYMDDVGLTLISLFGGFVIVAAIDLGLPARLVVLTAGPHRRRDPEARGASYSPA
jgi:hypothetical protein